MAFFKSFQQNLPSINVTSLLDSVSASVSSKVDDLSIAVSDATYTVSDQLTEKVGNIISKVEEERARKAEEAEEAELAAQAAAEEEEEERSMSGRGKLRRQEQQCSQETPGGAYGDQMSGFLSKGRSWFGGGQQQQEEEEEEEEDEEERERRLRKEERRRERERRKEEERLREEEERRREEEEAERRRQEEERRQWEEERRRKEEERRKKEEERKRAQEAEEEEEQNIEEEEEEDECSRRNKFRKQKQQSIKKKHDEEEEEEEQNAEGEEEEDEWSQRNKLHNSKERAKKKKQEEEEEVEEEESEDPEQYQRSGQNNSKNKSHRSRSQDEEDSGDRRGSSSSQSKKNKRGQMEEPEEENDNERTLNRQGSTKTTNKDNHTDTSRSVNQKNQRKASRSHEEEEEEEEEKEEDEEEEEEEEDDYRKSGKGGKNGTTDKRKSSVVEKQKEIPRKNSGKDRGTEQGSSESEEERPWRRGESASQPQRTSGWGNNGSTKQSEKEAYNSRAPVVQANSVQRTRHPSQLNELQPPPYRASSQQQSRHQTRAQDSEEEEESEEEEDDEEEEESEEEECSDDPDMQKEDAPSDSTAVLGPEDSGVPPLPAGYEPEALGKYGTLDVAFEYESCEQRLAVTVTAATDIPELKSTGNVSWQVHLVLLPTKKQRAKTGVQRGPCPVFTETFRFSRVEQEALCNYAVRFRLYSVRRMKKEKVLGEKVFYLTKLNLEGKTALPVTLEPGSSVTGCGSMVSVSRSMGALSYHSTGESATPELLLGLLYNSTTGRLSAEIIKGTHFKNSASEKLPSKAPPIGLFCCVKQCIGGQLYIMRDTYVKLMMLDSKGKRMSKCKTSVCRGQPSPTYKETFMFQVALFQLSEVTLHVSVYSRRSSVKRRERLGWVALGLNSTSEEQEEHWTNMREAEGQQICQWHTLMGT